jgi:O-antigen biosynthesis protein
MPKVSAIIPVRNRPIAVRRAIESVLGQTFQDFELVVVDDGSTDDTAAAVAAIADPRLTLIGHDRTRGASAARNTGIRAGSAPYVAFLDSDDEWLPVKLERQLEVFARSPAALALVYTGAEYVRPDGRIAKRVQPRHGVDITRALLTKNVIGGTSVGMGRRSALDAIGGFDESLPARQDVDLWLRLSDRFLVDFVPEVLVKIAKGNDRSRISASVTGKTAAWELFYQKHRQMLTRQGVLHLYLRESGWLHYRQARDPRLARRLYLESIAARPGAPLSYLLLLLAVALPPSSIDRVGRWRRHLVAWLRSGCEACRPRSTRGTGRMRELQKRTP